ncbi:transcription initiation factor IIA subunit 1-like [Amphibalanus amphitrite]|uniref:transcription initiation factor IIA subunit 1-like n=1 Tax=Amphibalanus amphitrite TaxID=1232801 RepID=UPI001C8FF026|nr:transcription initiation factor IIA subunit 1-like [Amphibalanus amphitrite]
MSHVHCHSHAIVGQVYKSVVNDTIAAVRSFFLDEGVDEQVLQELKTLWETKLNQSRAVDLKEAETTPQQSKSARASAVRAAARSAAPAAGAAAQPVAQPQSLVPIQITIPPQQPGGENKTIVVQVPVSAVQSGLAGQHLQTILSSAAAQATFALPPDIASSMLQQQLNEALRQSSQQQQRVVTVAPAAGGGVQYAGGVAPAQHRLPGQLDGSGDSPPAAERAGASFTLPAGACAAPAPAAAAAAAAPSRSAEERRRADRRLARRLGLRVPQTDGLDDTSDSDDDVDDDVEDDIDDDDDDIGNDEDEEDQEGQEEEPLNSEDDVSDHEPADLQETFNVMVCQYDKITRSRNRWKFHLKDGIMNLDGKDYIFQKAGGDAEW